MLKEGLTQEKKYTVGVKDTAKVVGSGDLDVLATPALISYFENAAMLLVASEIDTNLTTVGGYVELKHLKPTLLGKEFTISTHIISVEGKKINFLLEAYDQSGLIAEGSHTRFIVDRTKFMARLQE